jgi:hypothetical protein
MGTGAITQRARARSRNGQDAITQWARGAITQWARARSRNGQDAITQWARARSRNGHKGDHPTGTSVTAVCSLETVTTLPVEAVAAVSFGNRDRQCPLGNRDQLNKLSERAEIEIEIGWRQTEPLGHRLERFLEAHEGDADGFNLLIG